MIIILSVLNGILVLLRAATAVYTVYDIYLQYFASTSPLYLYTEVVRSVMTKYVLFVCITFVLYAVLIRYTRVRHSRI